MTPPLDDPRRERARHPDEVLDAVYRRGETLRRRAAATRTAVTALALVAVLLVAVRLGRPGADDRLDAAGQAPATTATTASPATGPVIPDRGTTAPGTIAPGTTAPTGPVPTEPTTPTVTAPEPVAAGGGAFASVCRFTGATGSAPPPAAGPGPFALAGGVGGGTTTCERPSDRSLVAVRRLSVGGRELAPVQAWVQWFGRPAVPTASNLLTPVPPGLVLGAAADDLHWTCGDEKAGSAGVPGASTAPACPAGSLKLVAELAPCWDGIHLDSADHASHLARPTAAGCPATHPVLLPRLGVQVFLGPSAGGVVTTVDGGPPEVWLRTGLPVEEQRRLFAACFASAIDCGRTGP